MSGLDQVLAERKTDVVSAMHGLCDALGKLGRIRDALEARNKRLPTDDDARMQLALERACTHLVEAVNDIPESLWTLMANENLVGVEEFRAKLETVTRRAA